MSNPDDVLAELADEIEEEARFYHWPENKERASQRVAALRAVIARDPVRRARVDATKAAIRKRIAPVQQGNCSNCGVPYANHTECGEFG